MGLTQRLDLISKCMDEVTDAIRAELELKEVTLSFRVYVPALFLRRWEVLKKKMSIKKRLLDSSAKVLLRDHPKTRDEDENVRKVPQTFVEYVENLLRSLSEINNALERVAKGNKPMTPD